MGTITIKLAGSFGDKEVSFTAIDHGHAHCVAEAMMFLSGGLLPAAINQDHDLRNQGLAPGEGFNKDCPHASAEANAVLQFAAWLTTRDEQIVASASDDAAPMAKLVDDYIKMRLS